MTSREDEIASVLADRRAALRMLMNHPQTKRDLDNRLKYSRSTINRAVRELRDAELIHYEGGVWKPTFLGKHAYCAREEYHSYLRDFVQAKPLFNDLPVDDIVDRDILEGSEVHQAHALIPDAVLNTLFEHITGSKYLSLFTPILPIKLLENFHERLTTPSTEKIDIFVPENALRAFHEINPDLIERYISNPKIDMFMAVSPFSFGMWISDNARAGLIAYSEHGASGLLINDSESAIGWAEDKFERLDKRNISISWLRQH